MMDPSTAYFLKKYYPHVIKWWLVMYNPEYIRIWPSKAEEDEALRLEAMEREQSASNEALLPDMNADCALPPTDIIDDSAFNATTGSYSGLYGQKPVDADMQATLDAIMNQSNNQSNIDFLLAGGNPTAAPAYSINSQAASSDVVIPPEQAEVIAEANAIYERLLREAAEDEAKKQAEIEKARLEAEQQFLQNG